MLNFGKRKKTTNKILFLFLSLAFTACSSNTPQAFSTFPAASSTIINTQTSVPSSTRISPPSTTPTHSSNTPEPKNLTSPQSRGFPDLQLFNWETVASNLKTPVAIAQAGDGSNRIFIVEKAGRIRVFNDGVLLDKPFLDIQDRIGSDSSEQGLLGLDFHPDFHKNGLFFVNYTDLNGNTVISRFEVSSDPGMADPTSEKRILSIEQPYPNHNGGSVVFGPDGNLYLGLGDGGAGGDPLDNAENTNSLLGKILRIDVNTDQPYTIPPDNPFASDGGRPEIWAYGLRNPWRFSFDRLTGDLFIGDVGQNQWEEINFQPADSSGGSHFGWDFMEGTHPFEGEPPENLIPPIYEYDHSQGCSVIGGIVYRGSELPEWQGIYLFADYCSGNIWGLIRDNQGAWEGKLLYKGIGNITSLGEDESGEIYLITNSGDLMKFTSQKP